MSGMHSQFHHARRRRRAVVVVALLAVISLTSTVIWAPIERAQLLVALVSAPLTGGVVLIVDSARRSHHRRD